jgi:integrase/recombinase XerD
MNVEFDGVLKRFYITSYKNYLIDNSYDPATINKKVNSIGAFNNFLITKGYMQENIIDLKKDMVKIAVGSEHQVEVYSDNQLERLQFYIQNQKKVSIRDKMIIQLLMFTGVRVSELCDIKLKNIDFLMSQIKIIGKGGIGEDLNLLYPNLKNLPYEQMGIKDNILYTSDFYGRSYSIDLDTGKINGCNIVK